MYLGGLIVEEKLPGETVVEEIKLIVVLVIAVVEIVVFLVVGSRVVWALVELLRVVLVIPILDVEIEV